MSRDVEIYGIYDNAGRLRYIGKAKSAYRRFSQHLAEQRRHTPFYCWLRKALSEGNTPTCKVLEVCSEENWAHAEKEHIFQARLRGEQLLNLADGGDCPKTNPKQLKLNAQKLNETRLKGYHRMCCELGRGLKFALQQGNDALVAKLNQALEHLRRMTQEQKQRASAKILENYPSWQS